MPLFLDSEPEAKPSHPLGLALDGFCWKRYTDVRDGGDTCCSHHPHRRQDSHKRFQQVQSRVANGNDIVYLKKVTT